MEQLFEQGYTVPPSMCDDTGRLAYHAAFSVFMDAATEHAERLGAGVSAMLARGFFWLTVRTKILFYERPRMGERLRLLTWPEEPGRVRFNRSYELRRGDTLLIAGRTEWAVLNTESGTVVPGDGIFPEEIVYGRGAALEERYARIPDSFDNAQDLADYRVCSTDIDLGRHMNNTAYLRALFGAFSTEEIHAMKLHGIDVIFRAPCFEGDVLRFSRRESENGLDLRIARGEETVLLGRFVY